MIRVKHILSKKGCELFTLSPEQSVFNALKLLAEKDIGAVVVMETNKLVGIFSERDFARNMVAKEFFSKESCVRDLMTKDVITVTIETDIFKCMEIMTEKRLRHLPVIEKEQVVGLISIGDVVNTIIRSQEASIKTLEGYISGSSYGHAME